MRKAAGYIANTLATLLVAAGRPGTSGSVDGPVIRGNDRNEGDDGDPSGTAVIEGDCIYLHGPLERFPIVWPNGTSRSSEEEAIELPDATLACEGGHMSGRVADAVVVSATWTKVLRPGLSVLRPRDTVIEVAVDGWDATSGEVEGGISSDHSPAL